MKKTAGRVFVFLALVLLAAVLCAALIGIWRGTQPLAVSAQDMPLDSGRDVMYIRLENASASEVSGEQRIKTRNRSGANLEEIVLRVFANGGEAAGTAARGVDVTDVRVNDKAVSFAFDEEDPTVLRVRYAWKAEEEIELSWRVSAPLSQNPTLITLPVLGVLEDGVWRTDPWDPLVQGGYAQAFDWEIRMEHHDDIDVLFGGALMDGLDASGGRIAQARMLGARDVMLLATRGKATRYRQIGGVKVAAVADSVFDAQRLLRLTEKALSSLEQAGFVYPFPALTVAQMQTGYEDGYAASCFAALNKESDEETQLRRLTRLIARQTFGVLVGVDPFNEPWLSRSLSSAAELAAYRARRGEAAYEARFYEDIEISTRVTRPYGVTVGADVWRFGGDAEMTQVLRDQGGAMLMGLAQAMGQETLVRAMNLYAQNGAYRIAQRADFEAALEAVSGSSWSGYLEDELFF